MSEWLIYLQDWIQGLGDSFWVYPALWAFATIDGFFPPIPSESVLIALSAVSKSTGSPSIWLIALFGAFGAWSGDQIAYTIGSKVKIANLRIFRSGKGLAALGWAERSLEHRGASFILAARYIPIGRVAVNMTAGALHYPRRRFMGLSALAGVTWAIYSVSIGVGAGHLFEDNPLIGMAAGVAFGVFMGFVIDFVLQRVLKSPAPDVLGPVDVLTAHSARNDTAQESDQAAVQDHPEGSDSDVPQRD